MVQFDWPSAKLAAVVAGGSAVVAVAAVAAYRQYRRRALFVLDNGDVKSLVLPYDEVFRNLANADRFAIDIGGSLTKLAYFSTVRKKGAKFDKDDDAVYSVSETDVEGMRLHFIKFETKYIDNCLAFIQMRRRGLEPSTSRVIKATGGGAHKYFDLIRSTLSVEVDKEDEVECLIKGCNFLLRNIPDEAFTYHHHDAMKYNFQMVDPCAIFPYMLVNIGSGVSVLSVESDNIFRRVGGSSIGGGTFWGLGTLLTGADDFDGLLTMAEEGDHRNVDLVVSDIYGGAYGKLGLPADLIASSFAKNAAADRQHEAGSLDLPYRLRHLRTTAGYNRFRPEDKARSLLLMISNSIGQTSVLYARQLGIKCIYFGGFFLRNHPITMRTISYAVDFWSQGEIKALFLRHEGYLGAIGAFLIGAEEDSKKHVQNDASALYSWKENYAGCSGLGGAIPAAFLNQNCSMHLLEMDCAQMSLVVCPLLRYAAQYKADEVDLTQDAEAREHWLQCFESGVDKSTKKAIESQRNSDDAHERAENFKHRYVQHLRWLRHRPFAYGYLNVRSLLDLNEQLLNEFYFPDAYQMQKRVENEMALAELPAVLDRLDALSWTQRQLALAQGILAGNVFDWGAMEVVALLEGGHGLSFEEAKTKLQPRPWLCDNFDEWLARRQRQPTHRCALIFVDNSGADIVLGVLPFARELIRDGTNVILAANSRPTLNDVTASELQLLVERIAKMRPEFSDALADGRLSIADNGQASPCLDLRQIDKRLAQQINEKQVDLVVLEGMGRAVHTNYSARFTCDALKAAVIKNQWLAQRHGGKLFSAIFKYEQGVNTQ